MKRQRAARLETPRLSLRAMRDEDRDAVVEMFLDGEISKTYMIPDFADPEEAVALFQRFRALSEDPGRFVYGVYLEESIIGFVNEVDKDEEGMEVGYVIAPGWKNRGYATEALTAVIGELFDMGYTVVRAGAFAENRASMRVMEKAGMTCLGSGSDVEYRGAAHPCVDYAIRKGEETAAAIARVKEMEEIFDTLLAQAEEKGTADEGLLSRLLAYYEGGQWLWDYHRDEAGGFPDDLKRGVLSQDGVYNLLTDLNR